MKVGKTLYVKNRREWRAWLAAHHRTAPEIWLIYYKKDTGKPRIPYNHAVEEALCHGWIDSITKPVDGSRWAQRFSPRRSTSRLSDMTRERVRRLIKAKRMTKRQASPGGLRAAAALLPEDDRAEQAVRDGAVTAA